MNEKTETSSGPSPVMQLAGAIELAAWCRAAGVSRTTAWEWRRDDKLKVLYRYGRAFVTAEENRRLTEAGNWPGRFGRQA